MRPISLVIIASLTLFFAACDDDDNSNTGAADTTASDTTASDTTESDTTESDTTESDATEGDATEGDATEGDATEGDATESDATESDATEGDATESDTTESDTSASCDHNGFTAVAEDSINYPQYFFYIAQSTLADPVDVVSMDLVPSVGGADAVGTWYIEDENYADCGNCFVLSQGCNAELADCGKVFLATSGTLDITTWGDTNGTFAGTVTDVTMIEVTIGDDLTSTPVAGGETWCIDSYAFSSVIQ